MTRVGVEQRANEPGSENARDQQHRRGTREWTRNRLRQLIVEARPRAAGSKMPALSNIEL